MRLIALMLLLTVPALAQAEWPTEGQVVQRLQVDLDRDGRAETVGLVAYDVGESSWFGQLVVLGPDGKTLWKGPRPKDAADPMAFGSWDWGAATLELAGDLDGDGKVEILGALPQSDVRPATFRVLRWTGQAFKPAFSRSLIESSGGRYPWVPFRDPVAPMRWVGSFESQGRDGTAVAQIYQMKADSVQLGTAVLAPDAKGFHVVRWISPPR